MSCKEIKTYKYSFICDHCEKELFSLKAFENDLKILDKILCGPCYEKLRDLAWRYTDLCEDAAAF